METVSARELKNHTGAILSRVRAGSHIEVTNRGRVVAILNPPGVAAEDVSQAIRPYDEAWADIHATLAQTAPEFPSWQEAMRQSRGRA
jgi:antitoxin (DNA-binding transcriptional repressor) of toxin-antitoxin stability system